MTYNRWHLFLCNGAKGTPKPSDRYASMVRLDYLGEYQERSVNFEVPDFIRQVQHVPNRALDLLELASYIYCADRSVSRGSKDDVVYSSWTQNIAIRIKVRDYQFWSRPEVGEALVEALQFMSGLNFRFEFQPGHQTPPAGLFDRPGILQEPEDCQVILFSGGIDSLTGVCQALKQSGQSLYLVSHRSQNITFRTQRQLYQALRQGQPADRVKHMTFACNLSGERAREETQRTRFFLYSAMAFALSIAVGRNGFYVYENGMTSLNLAKSQQLMNARNSRTTHPKTLDAMQQFLGVVSQNDFRIYNPFAWMTKADVVAELVKLGYGDLLSSSVSCSRTFDEGVRDVRTHCGRCSQCIDRRIAIYAAGCEDYDNEDLYVRNFISEDVESDEPKTMLMDYLRQAANFKTISLDRFYEGRLDDLTDIVPAVGQDEEMVVEAVHDLCQRHGHAALQGVQRMRLKEDLTQPVAPNSLLGIISGREYLNNAIQKETLQDAVNRFGERLRACPTGEEHFAQFERIGIDIWRFLFRSALGEPKIQRITSDGRQRRDVLFRNNRTTLFFQRVADKFKADHIIVDFKNYGKPIGANVLDDVAKYANEAIGYFIVVVSRRGPNMTVKSAQIRLLRGTEGKAILVLSDEHLMSMLEAFVRGEQPESTLESLLDELLISY